MEGATHGKSEGVVVASTRYDCFRSDMSPGAKMTRERGQLSLSGLAGMDPLWWIGHKGEAETPPRGMQLRNLVAMRARGLLVGPSNVVGGSSVAQV